MAQVLVNEDYLDDIGKALQEQLDTTDRYDPSQFGGGYKKHTKSK